MSRESKKCRGIAWPRWLVPICLLAMVAFSFLIRIEDLRSWNASPAKAFFQGEPLLTNIDGYYYLRIARDLAEGTYSPVDPLRITPDHPHRAAIPPLLSVIATALHETVPFSFNWIGILIPPLLGSLLVFPLYGLGCIFGTRLTGCIAALTGVISNTYFVRTSLGWFDTDCLNVVLSLAITYFFLAFAIEQSRKRYWSLAAGVLTLLFFLWWWDMARQAVVVIGLAPLAVALIFYYRPTASEKKVALGFTLAGVLILVILAQQTRHYEQFYQSGLHLLDYVRGKETGAFPNVSQLVGEQSKLRFIQIVENITDSYPVFILGCIGLVLLCCHHLKKSLFLLVPVLLGGLGIFFAQRFLLFLGPVIGLGLAYLITVLWRLRQRFFIFQFAVPILLVLIVSINLYTDLATTQWPKFSPSLVKGFRQIEQETPRNSVVWAWWDWGHPLIYWSRRATVTDGAAHDGELSVYNAIPFATANMRLAANWITFHVTYGRAGYKKLYREIGGGPARGLPLLKKILASGPEKGEQLLRQSGLDAQHTGQSVAHWLAFFFPEPKQPIYLFLDYRMGQTAYWWYWLGTWDASTRTGVHTRFMSFFNVGMDEKGATNHQNFYADFTKGNVLLLRFTKLLKAVSIYDLSGEIRRIQYQHKAKAYLEIFQPGRYAALERKDIRDSLFNRLFIRHDTTPFFIPVRLDTPIYQLYQVRGDILRSKENQNSL